MVMRDAKLSEGELCVLGFRGGGGGCVDCAGELEDEGCALGGAVGGACGAQGQSAAEAFGDFFCYPEAEAGSHILLRGEEGFEDAVDVMGRDAGAVVFDGDLEDAAAVCRGIVLRWMS